MKQQALGGFEKYGKTTRRARVLTDMDRIVPSAELTAVVDPVYPKVSQAGGRPPVPLERMLRIYVLQLWLNQSDPAVEEALYDSAAMRSFVGVDLGAEAAHVPDVDALPYLLHGHETRVWGDDKSRVRAKVEHSIGVIKRIFGFQKVRYRGLVKNLHRLEVTAAPANLFMMRRRLLHV